jgi:hypothetical protein
MSLLGRGFAGVGVEGGSAGAGAFGLFSTVSLAKTNARPLPVTIATSRALITPMVTMIARPELCEEPCVWMPRQQLGTRTAQPTTSGSASFVTMV